jgi:hypothetical protein
LISKINDKDIVRVSSSYDQDEESVVDLVSPLIYDIYHEEEPLEKVNLPDKIFS